MKIAIAGTGCIGLANALLLAQHHSVVAFDVKAEKVAMIKVINDLEEFKTLSGVIVANRAGEALVDVACKVYSRDLFGVD